MKRRWFPSLLAVAGRDLRHGFAAAGIGDANADLERQGDMSRDEKRPTSAEDAGRCRGLSEEVVALTVERLRVMAEPNRIGLLEALNQGEASVQELADATSAPHQKVSKHLGVLYGAGMVSRRRQGATVRYSLVDWTGWWVVEQIGRWVESSLGAQRERQAESER